MLAIRQRALFIGILFIIFIPFVSEAGDFSLSIDQGKVRLIVPAGGSQAGEIKVNSLANYKMSVKVYAEDWVYEKNQDGSKNFSRAGSQALSCADWLKFSPVEFVLAPYGVKVLNYVVRLPADAVGGHYCVLFFESIMGENQDKADAQDGKLKFGTSLSIRMGSLFYIEAKDTIQRTAEISNLSLVMNDHKQLEMKMDFKNTGNTDIITAATFDIMDKKGLVYSRGKFNDLYTMPQDAGVLTATCKEPLSKGLYSVVMTIDLGKALEEAGIGRGPVLVKEAQIEIGAGGELVKAGALK